MKFNTALLVISLFIFAFFSINCRAAEISKPGEYIPQNFDVLGYDVQIDMTDPDPLHIKGVCDIKFRWTSDVRDTFFFHLNDLDITGAEYEGIPVGPIEIGDPDASDHHFSVVPPAGDFGDTITLRIAYSGKMTNEGAPGYWGGVHKNGNGAYALGVGDTRYVSMTRHWMPCYDHPSDKARFSASFRVKPEMTALSNGRLVSESNDDGFNVLEWKQSEPCATYLLTFAVNEYVSLSPEGVEPPHVYYYEPKFQHSAPLIFSKVPEATRRLEEMFGEYPYEKVGYVITPKGSMEHQSLISLGEPVLSIAFGMKDSLYNTIVHELAHQWFGDLVSPLDFREVWLSEGFATYATDLVYQSYYNHDYYLNNIQLEIDTYYDRCIKSDGVIPLYDFNREETGSYPYTIYMKGSAVLHLLHYELGDSLFFEGVRQYLDNYRYASASTEMLRKTLEEAAGRDLGWFFDQWVYGHGWPVVQISAEKLYPESNIHANINIRQIQPKSYGFYNNLPIELSFAGKSDTLRRIVTMTTPTEDFYLSDLNDFDTILVNRGHTVRTLLEVESNIIMSLPGGIASVAEIFPNPAADMITLRLPADSAPYRARIINSTGNQVREFEAKSGNNHIYISGLPAGVYLVVSDGGELPRALRFVKFE